MRWLSRLLGIGASGGAGSLGPPGGFGNWGPSWQASSGAFSHFGKGTRSGETVSEVSALGLPAIYRACSLISDALASMDLRVMQQQPGGGSEVVTDSDAARALSDWSFEDREMVLFNLALNGNGFARILRNARGGIAGLEPKLPRRISALRDEANELWFRIAPDIYCGEGEPVVVAAGDMLHVRFRNVGDRAGRTVFGTPPIASCAEGIGLVLAARSYQGDLWANGAYPSGVLQTPEILSKDVVERLRTFWSESYSGMNRGKPAVLEQNLKWQAVEPTVAPADAQLLELSMFGVNEIARAFGIPPSLLSQTLHASYSTSVEESRALVLHCLRPFSIRLCDALAHALLTRDQRLRGMSISADLTPWTLAPGKESAEFYGSLVGAGILSTNEARNALGFEDIEGGDVHRVPVNSTALSNLPKIGLGKPNNSQEPQP